MDVFDYFSSNMESESSLSEDNVEYLIHFDDDEEFNGFVLRDDDERVEQAFDGYVLPDDDEVEFEEEFNDYVLPDDDQEVDEFDFEQPAVSAAVARLKTVVIEAGERHKTCSICLEELEVGREAAAIECSHKFHKECLLPWLATKATCPCCRVQLLM